MEVRIKRWEWILLIVLFIVGFLLGRLTIKEEKTEVREKVSYVPSPYAVHDTLRLPESYLEYRTKIDTIYLAEETAAVDSARIVEDYFLTRNYRLDFSNDSTGVFLVDAKVNQNRIVEAKSEIRPIVKTIEREYEKTIHETQFISFYATVGSSLNWNTQKVSLGVDLKEKYLIGVSGIRLDNNFNYTIDLGIKF